MPRRSFRTTFATSRLLTRIGVKGGHIPDVDLESYVPVLVMGDFSKTLSSEPIEARGFSAEIIAAASGARYGTVELQTVSPGGLVVEFLRLSLPSYAGVDGAFYIHIREAPLWGMPDQEVQQIGGTIAVSRVRADQLVIRISTHSQVGFKPGDRSADFGDARIYLRPGTFLTIQSAIAATPMGYQLAWRELPEPVGASA